MHTHTETTRPSTTGDDARTRRTPLAWATWLIPLHGLLLLWGTWERQPTPSTHFADWSDFVTTDLFLWNHLVASIAGQAAAVVGTAGLTIHLLLRGARRTAVTGFVLHALGSGLLLAGFGVAAFAQPAIGALHAEHPQLAEDLYNDVYSPIAIVVLLSGAALFGLSTIWTGLAVKRLGIVPTWAAVLLLVAGPMFAVIGFFLGAVQSAGAVALLVGGAVVARAVTATREQVR